MDFLLLLVLCKKTKDYFMHEISKGELRDILLWFLQYQAPINSTINTNDFNLEALL